MMVLKHENTGCHKYVEYDDTEVTIIDVDTLTMRVLLKEKPKPRTVQIFEIAVDNGVVELLIQGLVLMFMSSTIVGALLYMGNCLT